jgi:hypothetical protein
VLPNLCPPAVQAAVPTSREFEVGPNLLAGRTDSQRWWQLVHGQNVAMASDTTSRLGVGPLYAGEQ